MAEELIFFRTLPGVDLQAEEIWETFRRSGMWRKKGEELLEHLPVTEVLKVSAVCPAGWRTVLKYRTGISSVDRSADRKPEKLPAPIRDSPAIPGSRR